MTGENHALDLDLEKDNAVGDPDNYFDGNEQELPDPEEDSEGATLDGEDGTDVEEEDQSGEGEETEDEEGEDSAPDLETVEVEYEGKKYKLAPELKDALLRQADYTRKTQGVAEKERSVEAERESLQKMAQITSEEIGMMADLRAIDAQLQQYQNVNWQQLEAEDPLAADSHFRRFVLLEKQRTEAANKLGQTQQQRLHQADQMSDERLRKTAEHAQKTIPNWSTDLDNQITQFAVESGFTVDALKSAYTPEVYTMLWKAWVGDQVLKKQAASKPKPKPQGEKKPLTTVGKSNATPAGKKSLNDMGMDEYAAEMNRREKARGQRR